MLDFGELGRAALRALIGFVLFAVMPALGQQTTAPAVTTRPALSRPQVEQWVNQLARPEFKLRDQATKTLCEASDETLPTLAAVYRDEKRLELKLRLRYVIETVFYRKLLEGRLGFLGVGPRSENGIADPATGKATEVVLVARVLTGFPGAQAGLLTGDMIVDFDGKSIADLAAVPRAQARKQAGNAAARQRAADPPIAAFTAEISRREPGTRVPLRLLRCTTQHRVLPIAAAQEPARTLDGASLVPTILPNLSAQFNPLVGPGMRPGLYVMGVAADSPAATANLKPGDVILGMGRPFAQSGTLADELARQLAGANPGSPINLIVSHVKEVRLTVTLGGRPVDRMNEDDMIIAQNRFADWWRSQTGEPSLRSGAAPSLPQLIIRPPNALPDPVVLP